MYSFPWVAKRNRRQHQPRRAARPQPFRPNVESLERRELLSTYTVTSAADSGPGSLRQAILDSNAHPGPNSIVFAVGGGDVQTITPLSPLPAVTVPATLDATTQPGYYGTPLVVLDGSAAGAGANGLILSAGNSTVTGFDIQGFGGDGILIQGAGGDLVTANYIGTDVSGTAAAGNGASGVYVNSSPNNRVGGNGLYPDNVVSGNGADGVTVTGAGSTGNLVEGNFIGIDVTGTVALGNAGNGVAVSANGNFVGRTPYIGNVIAGNGRAGVLLAGSNNLVAASYIGTDYTGTVALPNDTGVSITASANTVGGADAGAGNVISGNQNAGVNITRANGNVVQNDFIGTDASGTVALGNGTGVLLFASPGNNIGGRAFLGNVISGNRGTGITLNSQGLLSSSNNQIIANFIGTDVTGTFALGNGSGGISIASRNTGNNTIGGTAPGTGNLISGNGLDGIDLVSTITGGSATTVIQGNAIGINSAGAPLGNAEDGVHIGVVPVGGFNTIGGTAPGAGNIIAYNGRDGVFVYGVVGNTIRGNSIYGHTNGLGIELRMGGNQGQAAPGLTSANSAGGHTVVQGTLHSTASATFTLDFYADSVCNPSGFGEGERYVGTATATTNASGVATFSITLTPAVPPGQFVSATATDPNGNTSAFGNCQAVTGTGAPGAGGPTAGWEAVGWGRDVPAGQPVFVPNTPSALADAANLPPHTAGEVSDPPAATMASAAERLAVRRRLDAFFARAAPTGLVDLPELVAGLAGAAG